MFDKILEKHAVIQVLNWRYFSDPIMENEIQIIQISTNIGNLFLQVNIDTDELYWSNEFQDLHKYQLTKPQLDLRPCTIVNYWFMINQRGYQDAVQFEIRIENKTMFVQFIAIASRMKLLRFYEE